MYVYSIYIAIPKRSRSQNCQVVVLMPLTYDFLESKRTRWWLPLCPWEEWDWPTSATMPFFCIRRSMCKKHLICAGDFCLSLEISRDREMKDKSGPLPPKNPTAGTWNWWLPIFSPLRSFPGKPCFVFPVVHPKNFGESLLDWNIVRRLFSRWGLQILSRKAGQRWKMMTEDAILIVCPPPPKKVVRKNSGDVGDEIFWEWNPSRHFFWGV